MSVDVEDYFHVSALAAVAPRSRWDDFESRVVTNTGRLLDLFDEFRVRATFFVLGWVADRHPHLVRRIADAGHELASHGYGHELVYDLSRDRFRDDVRRARRAIENAAGCAISGYRAPSYSITERSLWALDVLVEEGYRYDASIFPVHHDRYGVPDAPRHLHCLKREPGTLIEVPPSTVRLYGVNLPVSGGGYFRLLPYAWTRWGIARVNTAERQPAVFYLHPWELDPAQPRLRPSLTNRIRHYRNLHKTEPRLRALCRDFRFSAIADVIRACGFGSIADAGSTRPPHGRHGQSTDTMSTDVATSGGPQISTKLESGCAS
jgi:polysaccharide deacetylase family protein (PEP-CTERM system associated)